MKLKQCQEQLYKISDLLPQIDLPEDGTPITLEWMKGRQEEIANERNRIFSEKRSDSNKLTKYKEMVLSELEKLRGLNRAHRKLMVEVWQHLTALARVRNMCVLCVFEGRLEGGQIFPINFYYSLNEPRVYLIVCLFVCLFIAGGAPAHGPNPARTSWLHQPSEQVWRRSSQLHPVGTGSHW